MKRLFLAIHILPDERFLAVYMKLKHQLKSEKIRWVKPENLHITLKFLGETPIESIGVIKKLMYDLSANVAPFSIKVSGTGIFGSRYKPRVIWFRIEEQMRLITLASEIVNKLETAGFPIDRQNFVPHLSLGRLKKIEHKENFQKAIDTVKEVFIQDILVSRVTLFESRLLPAGVVYKTIEEYELKHQPG